MQLQRYVCPVCATELMVFCSQIAIDVKQRLRSFMICINCCYVYMEKADKPGHSSLGTLTWETGGKKTKEREQIRNANAYRVYERLKRFFAAYYRMHDELTSQDLSDTAYHLLYAMRAVMYLVESSIDMRIAYLKKYFNVT